MAAINRFEDILAWQEARVLCRRVYKLTGNSKDFGFVGQITRASVSIMNNIAEGFERNSDKELRQFLYIAKGSAGEVRSMVILGNDLGVFSDEETTELASQCEKIAQLLAGFIKKL
jgi:four helix bundle protein